MILRPLCVHRMSAMAKLTLAIVISSRGPHET